MKNLRKLFVAISFTIVLTGTALADCTSPGEMNTPPCTGATQQVTEDAVNQTTTTATATTSGEVEIVVIDTVISALEDLLTIY